MSRQRHHGYNETLTMQRAGPQRRGEQDAQRCGQWRGATLCTGEVPGARQPSHRWGFCLLGGAGVSTDADKVAWRIPHAWAGVKRHVFAPALLLLETTSSRKALIFQRISFSLRRVTTAYRWVVTRLRPCGVAAPLRSATNGLCVLRPQLVWGCAVGNA